MGPAWYQPVLNCRPLFFVTRLTAQRIVEVKSAIQLRDYAAASGTVGPSIS